jgi:pseudouridine-5'-phosphate glycosidase
MPAQSLINRSKSPAVALETTILVHGLPKDSALEIASQLEHEITSAGANAALVGIVNGTPIVGMNRQELETLIDANYVPKLNTSNLGHAMHTGSHGATTVSTTVELAELAGVRVFATGGIGGVHAGYDKRPDISADLGSLARHRVAVVTSGCKNILDLAATRELLETLGIPVIGYQTDVFPAFYQRETDLPVDARFDDAEELADFLSYELTRKARGVVVANPIPAKSEIPLEEWTAWLSKARNLPSVLKSKGRDATPSILAEVHSLSDGKTIEANISLARSNAHVAGLIASCM